MSSEGRAAHARACPERRADRARWVPLSILATVAGAVACDAPPAPDSPVARADSAGVEIVVTPDLAEPLIRLDTVPEISLGGPEAAGPEAFGRVDNVILGPDDSIWVSDLQAADVKVFNPDGSHRVTVGGRGDGPGEFQSLRLLGAAGDSVAVHDRGNGRLTWFGLDGALLSTLRPVSREGTNPLVYDVLEGDGLVGVESVTLSPGDIEVGSTYGGTVPFVIWSSPDRPPVEFTVEPTASFLWLGGSVSPAIPFTSTAQLTAADDHIDVAAGVAFEVRRYATDGSLERVARIAREPIPVDAAARADYRAFVEEFGSPPSRDAAIDALDHPDVPEWIPAYRLLVGGHDGSTWAYRFAPMPADQPWDVFLPDGSFAGAVTVPGRFRVTAATEDVVVGIWTDDLGVHHVRRYRIVGP